MNLRQELTRLLQLPLSPLMLIEAAIASFFFFLSILFVLWVSLSNLERKNQITTWHLPNNLDIGNQRVESTFTENDVLMRPIFNKNRRPNPKGKNNNSLSNDNSTLSEAPTNLTLYAIAKTNNEEKIFVKTTAIPDGAWYKVGESLDDWELKKINQNDVIISRGGIDAKLPLYLTDGTNIPDNSPALQTQNNSTIPTPPDNPPSAPENPPPPQPIDKSEVPVTSSQKPTKLQN